jgi:hypothetical protein
MMLKSVCTVRLVTYQGAFVNSHSEFGLGSLRYDYVTASIQTAIKAAAIENL